MYRQQLCNQRKHFSHDVEMITVEMNNKDILHFHNVCVFGYYRSILITKKIETKALISVLVIQRSKMSDAGDYVCRSSNKDTGTLRVHILNGKSSGSFDRTNVHWIINNIEMVVSWKLFWSEISKRMLTFRPASPSLDHALVVCDMTQYLCQVADDQIVIKVRRGGSKRLHSFQNFTPK